MTAMKRCRECWVDWQRFQDNESDMFKNNDTRQTHGAAQDTIAERLQGLERGAVFRRQN